LKIPLSKEEVSKLKCVFASEEKAASRRAVYQQIPLLGHVSVKLILEVHHNTKYRNRLNAVPDLKTQLSNIKPMIKGTLKEKRKTTFCIESCKYVAY
jgi:hypothetical protein